MKHPKSSSRVKDNPATFGGLGFEYRKASWESDLGVIWQNTRVQSDGDTLRHVSLAWPGDVYKYIQNPDEALLLEIPDVEKMRQQCRTLIDFYQGLGIQVDVLRDPNATPNWIFQRDLFNSTPDGVVLSRPASRVRRGEEVLESAQLSNLQIPMVAMIRGSGFMEGADILWLNSTVAFVGIGTRTNQEAVHQLQRLFPFVTFETFVLPAGIQHLLGLVNFIAPNKVGVWKRHLTIEHRQILERYKLSIVNVTDDVEIKDKRGFNWVCLAPNHLLLPLDSANIISQLSRLGMHISTVDISEYRKCGGGLGCLTGILCRSKV